MKQDVKMMYVDRGMTPSEIFIHMEGVLKLNTIQRYIADIKKDLTPADRITRETAKAQRGRSFPSRNPLSQMHHRVGIKLSWHRQKQDLSILDFANKTGFGNRKSIALMEGGSYDFTLSELHRIADILGVTFEQLIAPQEVKFK